MAAPNTQTIAETSTPTVTGFSRGRNHRRRRRGLGRRDGDSSTLTPSCSNEMFNNTRNVSISGGTFNNAGTGNAVVTVNLNGVSQAIDKTQEEVGLPSNSIPEVPIQPAQVGTLQAFAEDSNLFVPSITSQPYSATPRIYYEHLVTKGRGVPLHSPGPDIYLPRAYRLTGVRIGDVGIIDAHGAFVFLFNIFEEGSSEVNRGKVPKGFKHLQWTDFSSLADDDSLVGVDVDDVQKSSIYGPGSWIGSDAIEEIESTYHGSKTFRTCASEGAILVMPSGSSSFELKSRQTLRCYMEANLGEWYTYARHRGIQVSNGDIRLVYGCDKVSSWGIAAFKAASSNPQRTMHFREFNSAHETVSLGLSPSSSSWTGVSGGSGRVGPLETDFEGLDVYEPIDNQCIFIRTINAKLCAESWTKLMGNKTDSFDDIFRKKFQDRRGDPSNGYGSRSGDELDDHSSSSTGISASSVSGHTLRIQSTYMAGDPLPLPHPSEVLNNSLLEKYPGARMAITSDEDWISLLRSRPSTDSAKLLKMGIHRLHFEHFLPDRYEIRNEQGVLSLRTSHLNSIPRRDGPDLSRRNCAFRLKRHPHFYIKQGTSRFVAGNMVFKLQKNCFPPSLWRLLKSGIQPHSALDFVALCGEHMRQGHLYSESSITFANAATHELSSEPLLLCSRENSPTNWLDEPILPRISNPSTSGPAVAGMNVQNHHPGPASRLGSEPKRCATITASFSSTLGQDQDEDLRNNFQGPPKSTYLTNLQALKHLPLMQEEDDGPRCSVSKMNGDEDLGAKIKDLRLKRSPEARYKDKRSNKTAATMDDSKTSRERRTHPAKSSEIDDFPRTTSRPSSPSNIRSLTDEKGVTIRTITPGDGRTYPKRGDKVTIHYVANLADGTKFDSSRDRGFALQTEIGIGRVIKGWDEGIPKLSLGEKAILTTTPDYAYGSRGFAPLIPPNSTLNFEVELLQID